MDRLHLPMRTPEDVVPHLGATGHWREGRSARCVAEYWFAASPKLPAPIAEAFAAAPLLADAELIDGFFERKVALGDGGRASQTDLMVVLGVGDRLALAAIEAKVDESFGPLVAEWLVDSSEGKRTRLRGICATLGLDPSGVGALRYQLLHRAVSAVYEAQRYRSTVAAMIVQSFAPEPVGWSDFIAFAAALGLNAEVGRCAGPLSCDGVALHLGWVQTPWTPPDG